MKRIATFCLTAALSLPALLPAQQPDKTSVPPGLSFVNYDAFEKLTAEVKEHRKTRLLPLDDFLEASKEANTIILDTRSLEMYNRKHLKGAVHLAFADFTQNNLAKIIPSFETKILIYCNNNYLYDPSFASKTGPRVREEKPVTLALNIPTYINLYGYGYKNVYELAELVGVNDPRLEFEGSHVVISKTVADSMVTVANLLLGPRKTPMIGISPFVDYGAFEQLTAEVKQLRKDRLLSIDEFIEASKDPNTIILDTRADSLYKRKHIKGAVHLEFSDFTMENLAKVIPSNATRVLIYCNNNFYTPTFYIDQASFVTKGVSPRQIEMQLQMAALAKQPKKGKTAATPKNTVPVKPVTITPFTQRASDLGGQKPLTLALNIPTFINLVGYGYTNVYELADLVNIQDPRLEFEGSLVK